MIWRTHKSFDKFKFKQEKNQKSYFRKWELCEKCGAIWMHDEDRVNIASSLPKKQSGLFDC